MNKKILLIFLSVFGVLFIIYLILDKSFSDELNEKDNKETTYEIIESPFNEAKNIVLDYFDSIEEGNTYYIDLEDFKKESIKDESASLEINCNKKEVIDEDINYCTNINISIDDKILLSLDTIKNYYYDDYLTIFKTEKYYIVKQANQFFGSGILNIYDYDGKLVKEIKNNVTSYGIIRDEEEVEDAEEYKVSINDNKLYYAYTDDMDFVLGLDNLIHFGYIDLGKNLEFNETKRVKGITSLGI